MLCLGFIRELLVVVKCETAAGSWGATSSLIGGIYHYSHVRSETEKGTTLLYPYNYFAVLC